MIHRYSPIFTDIHGYSQIFTDIHRYSRNSFALMILVGSELSVVSGDTLWSFWSIGACGRQIPRALWRAVTVLCYSLLLVHTCIYLYMKRSESANCEEIGKVSRSAVSLQSLSDKVLSRVQSPPCHASPSSIFYSQPAPYSPHILGSHRGIRGVQGDPMAIHGHPILWRPRRSIDWGSTGRWSWPWTFFFRLFLASDSTWKSDGHSEC